MHPVLAAQWSARGVGGSPSAINALLDDFGTLLDTEWRLLLTLGAVLVLQHPWTLALPPPLALT